MTKDSPADGLPNVEPIMKEAMRSLDNDLKQEYIEAMDTVPHLVQTETPKAKFLRTEANNPWRAARRLALYWKFRKEIMTAERWLRPMHQTGQGTLGTPEVELLRRGIYHYTCNDEDGPVVFVDCCRNRGVSPEVSGRILFYLGTILNDQAVQTTGVTIVYVVTSQDTASHVNSRFGEYMAQGLPVKVRRTVVVQNYEPHKQSLVQYLAERRTLQIKVNYRLQCQLIGSDATSQLDLLLGVKQAGLPWQALPRSCGGLFDDQVLCEWMRQRISLEAVLSSCSPTQQLRLLVSGKKSSGKGRRRRRKADAMEQQGKAKKKQRKTLYSPPAVVIPKGIGFVVPLKVSQQW